MANLIQGYFFGVSYGEVIDGKPVGLSGFAIPDLGIVFRSRFSGSLYECQYAGLLSLLDFIEKNRKNFKEYEFEIMSDSALVIYQIAHRKFISQDLVPYYETALRYKQKVTYRVTWVPRHENIAIVGMPDTPPLKPEIPLSFELGRSSL